MSAQENIFREGQVAIFTGGGGMLDKTLRDRIGQKVTLTQKRTTGAGTKFTGTFEDGWEEVIFDDEISVMEYTEGESPIFDSLARERGFDLNVEE